MSELSLLDIDENKFDTEKFKLEQKYDNRITLKEKNGESEIFIQIWDNKFAVQVLVELSDKSNTFKNIPKHSRKFDSKTKAIDHALTVSDFIDTLK